jgi:hypothetical protein
MLMDDLQNINKLASALLLFIKGPNWISHKKYIEKHRWYLNLSATMKRQVCLHFANRPLKKHKKLLLKFSFMLIPRCRQDLISRGVFNDEYDIDTLP